MKIIKKIPVKQIITHENKEKLAKMFLRQKMQLEQECQQLLFEQKKAENKSSLSKQLIKERFEQEISRRENRIETLDFKLEQLDILEVGSEILEREVEALVEVKEGLHWNEMMKDQAIIIKDDIVIRIDQ